MADQRSDLHWLALRLCRGLGALELPVMRGNGLSLWGYEVLVRLADHPADSQLELAGELDLDKSKIVRVVDELEAAGYAERVGGKVDRRRRAVEITAPGRRVMRSTAADLRAVEQRLLSRLGAADDAEAALRGLGLLVAALRSEEV
ncbi:hypothetical protein GCM10023318_24880 [Nocardia callitridis]|uniref:HTH marR-type domain-containing protein n=2 Tax=Nocardia callitridis TaxID=648753 RepID=A0ABP9K8V2_9NOCA